MKNQKQELSRKNMYMSQEVATWYEKESERLGVSQSALMTMVLSQYIDQKKSLDMGDMLKEMMIMLKKEKSNKKD